MLGRQRRCRLRLEGQEVHRFSCIPALEADLPLTRYRQLAQYPVSTMSNVALVERVFGYRVHEGKR
jgi:hypothetical protein